ncbi:MAG: lamin tail domain-containing protein [Theionarchaea archaeon]|nr:lamin tail domain-containing protein [Theionarchaea archaeon]
MKPGFIVLLLVPLIAGTLEFPVERVIDMDICDIDNNNTDDYIFACHKIVSDPWDRGVIYVFENNQLQWYYHLSSVINAVTAHDLDGDGIKEIIAASDILLDRGYLYVFDAQGTLKWSKWLPGRAKHLYCYDNTICVNLYGQGERILFFDDKGRWQNDLPVNGSISTFIVEDTTNDGFKELVVSGIVNNKWEHFIEVYDLQGTVLWNFETDEHINDFFFSDIDADGIQETVIGSYDTLFITRGGHILGEIELPPPILHVDLINDQILVVNSTSMFLLDVTQILASSGELVPISEYYTMISSALEIEVSPHFVFIRDVDHDDIAEILVGEGPSLHTFHTEDFGPPEEVITVPAEALEVSPPEEAVEEEAAEEEAPLYAITICEVQYDAPDDDNDNLNEEWVKLCNEGDTDIDMTGWTLENYIGIYFEFPDGFILPAGASIIIHSGAGENSDTDLYWNHYVEVWRNTGDTITLLDADGNIVKEYEWKEE